MGCVTCTECCAQVLVEAETKDAQRHSILLQNAETVRLVVPQQEGSSAAVQGSAGTVSVSELQVGQNVFVHLQGAARHTGISIQENIVEK